MKAIGFGIRVRIRIRIRVRVNPQRVACGHVIFCNLNISGLANMSVNQESLPRFAHTFKGFAIRVCGLVGVLCETSFKVLSLEFYFQNSLNL